uniref:Conotoxin n=2 Tax=Turriconus TaxID=1340131 RepID=A0A291C2Z7_CONPC|nr:conotoxin [Conus andremenezi]ATF27821.1 conotoxin [Conus praecellens]ATF27822.1 conotoxin [Conus praecellens]
MSTPRMMPLVLLLLLSLATHCGDGQAIQGDRRLSARLLRGYKERGLSIKTCGTCNGARCCGLCPCSPGEKNCSCLPFGK